MKRSSIKKNLSINSFKSYIKDQEVQENKTKLLEINNNIKNKKNLLNLIANKSDIDYTMVFKQKSKKKYKLESDKNLFNKKRDSAFKKQLDYNSIKDINNQRHNSPSSFKPEKSTSKFKYKFYNGKRFDITNILSSLNDKIDWKAEKNSNIKDIKVNLLKSFLNQKLKLNNFKVNRKHKISGSIKIKNNNKIFSTKSKRIKEINIPKIKIKLCSIEGNYKKFKIKNYFESKIKKKSEVLNNISKGISTIRKNKSSFKKRTLNRVIDKF